ncbi:Protein kinase [Mycena indigotica]|uniref:non-specific serine/threonine protein kinase n=1 Tax=Mycena indigotica TaxID=2126181 RepID=A0A8H6W8U5_9AGAR|nr:Protein kinase [Mycena indigotica]KAF7307321.1 Protein kinase [Mycena indigotica]
MSDSVYEYEEEYEPGGLHPVHIGDTFADGRYQVVNKLGNGYSSTIWLVRDSTSTNYASLKILEARRSESPTELHVLEHLEATFDAQDEGSKHVVRMLDHFLHQGPNGIHLCIVQELLGPSLALDVKLFWAISYLPESTSSRLVGQLILAVAYLHKRGIAQGDLHAGNILLCLPSPLDPDIDFTTVVSNTGELPSEPSPHKPRYLVEPVTQRLGSDLLQSCMIKPYIKLCDFSESYMTNMVDPPKFGSPHILRPPEGILTKLPHATLESDIWALAVAIYQLLTSGGLLFSEYDDSILEDMVLTLGKLPEPLWSKWANRACFFDEEVNPVIQAFNIKAQTTSFRQKVRGWTRDEGKISALAAMFETMARYDAQSRSRASELVQSDWMTNYCRPYMGDDVILPTERRKVRVNRFVIDPRVLNAP